MFGCEVLRSQYYPFKFLDFFIVLEYLFVTSEASQIHFPLYIIFSFFLLIWILDCFLIINNFRCNSKVCQYGFCRSLLLFYLEFS